MSADPIRPLLDRLRERARDDEALVETLAFLVEDDGIDPFARPSAVVLAQARHVNARRLSAHRHALAARALSTAQVVELIASMSDRRAVDRRRHRGRLLGVKVGNTVLHPLWQFDQRVGDTRTGLARVLRALAEVTDDPVAADALVMTPRSDLGGRTIANVFADGDVDLAAHAIQLAGDQS